MHSFDSGLLGRLDSDAHRVIAGCGSDLLEEDREPFEVLPGGSIGPSLLVALRTLLASDSVFQGWRGLEDALQPHLAQPANGLELRTANGASAAQPRSAPADKRRSKQGLLSGKEEKDSRGVSPEDEKSQPPTKRKHCGTAASACAPSKRHSSCCSQHADADEGPEMDRPCAGDHHGDCLAMHSHHCEPGTSGRGPFQLGSTGIAAAGLNARMCRALKACILHRIHRYRHEGMDSDLAELQAAEMFARKSGCWSESSKAKLAALRLIVEEKKLLYDALKVVDGCIQGFGDSVLD
jgi:hypothetical protein